MEPASTSVITWGAVKMIAYFVGAALGIASFAWGVHYLAKSNKSAIKSLQDGLKTEETERKASVDKLHKRIDRKQERFDNCFTRLNKKMDDSNKLLYLICGKLGISTEGDVK